MSYLRTIESVLDVETGKEVLAGPFFGQPEKVIFEHRRRLEEAIQGHQPEKFVCYYCRQLLKIRGGTRGADGDLLQIYHFAHLKDSGECPVKTSTGFSEQETRRLKYNGQKESQLHIETKELIGELLRANEMHHGEVSEVIVDQVLKGKLISKEWRKPDVRCVFKDRQVVFEVQLSTDFISVIAEREYFYRTNGIFIIWVFKSFDIRSHRQRFAQKDIFYGNNCNVYVLDEEAIHRSKATQDLILHCYYLRYDFDAAGGITDTWEDSFVSLRDLTYEQDKKASFFYDSARSLTLARRSKEIDRMLLDAVLPSDVKSRTYHRRIIEYFDVLREKYPQRTPFINSFLSSPYDPDHQAPRLPISYRPTSEDRAFLVKEFEVGLQSNKDSPAFQLAEHIAFYLFQFKSGINKLPYGLHKILYALLSLKQKKVIGFGYHNLSMVAHKIFEPPAKYADMLVYAIDIFGCQDILRKEDKSGKLQKKIEQRERVRPEAELALIKKVFPELKDY